MAKFNMTRVDALTLAIAHLDSDCPEEVSAVLSHMAQQLSKPRATSSAKSPSKARLENETVAREVAEMVSPGESISSSYVVENSPYGTTLSPVVIGSSQKAVSVMKVAEELGLFSRAKEGKKVVYVRAGE